MADEVVQKGRTERIDVRQVALIRIDRRVWYAILSCFLSCVLLCVLTLVVAVKVGSQNDKNFCDLLGTYDQVFRDNPPTTETGRTLAVEVHSLVMRLGCES